MLTLLFSIQHLSVLLFLSCSSMLTATPEATPINHRAVCSGLNDTSCLCVVQLLIHWYAAIVGKCLHQDLLRKTAYEKAKKKKWATSFPLREPKRLKNKSFKAFKISSCLYEGEKRGWTEYTERGKKRGRAARFPSEAIGEPFRDELMQSVAHNRDWQIYIVKKM